MSSTRTTYLGVPLVSHNGPSDTPVQQPIEGLEPVLMALLADPLITAFGWRQYTPYFNDGEPCYFMVHEPWFVTRYDPQPHPDPENDGDVDHEWSWDDYTISHHPTLGHRGYRYVRNDDHAMIREPRGDYEGKHEASWKRCNALSSAIGSGVFDHALLAKFGDHAEITIRPTGITVDDYSHE